MSARSRNKGARGERELARILSDHLGVEVARNLTQTRDGGHDLDGLPFALEVKRCERLALKAWWNQAVEQAEEIGKTPALAYRQNRQPWAFVVPLYAVAEVVAYPANTMRGGWAHRFEFTCQLGIEAFCLLARESLPTKRA